MKKINWGLDLILIVLTLIIGANHLRVKNSYKDLSNYVQKLERHNEELKDRLDQKSDALSACTKAIVGAESGMIALYDAVDEDVRSIEMLVHTDTESGEPKKFVLTCGGVQ